MQIDIITEKEIAELKSLIGEANNIILVGHKSPDGDALGACLGWAEYLRQQGKSPSIFVPDAYPDFLKWLPGTEKIVRYDKHKVEIDAACKHADLIFCLDLNDTARLEDMQECVNNSSARKVLIDHHLNPVVNKVLSVSHPEACSTCELIFRLIYQMSGIDNLTRKIAVPLYCGMMTDTGGFTYNSSRPEIYTIIGLLLTVGIDKDKIYRNVFNNYSPWAIKFRGYLLSNKLVVFDEYHASYFTVSKNDMKAYHFIKGDLEGLVNEPLRIKGQKLSISLREDDRHDNVILVSLRSVDDFPCNKVSEKFFNGGGHLNASGGKLHCSLGEAENIAKKAIQEFGDMLKA
jgi:phosphoesterase RecJ-like protein